VDDYTVFLHLVHEFLEFLVVELGVHELPELHHLLAVHRATVTVAVAVGVGAFLLLLLLLFASEHKIGGGGGTKKGG